MRNYHGENCTFTVGMTVIHVDDQGAMHKGKVSEIKGDLMHIEFADGDEGWEKADTCWGVSLPDHAKYEKRWNS